MDIVLEISDTKVIGTLVLPGTDLRLYEWEGESRGLSERGRRRGGAVAARRERAEDGGATVPPLQCRGTVHGRKKKEDG